MIDGQDVKKLSFFLQIEKDLEKCWLVSDGGEPFFLPKSCCSIQGPVNKYRQADFIVPEWLARKKGLWD
jgi:hypothetical protein